MIRAAIPGDADAMGAILSGWIDATPWMPRIHTREQDAAFCASLVPHAWIAGDRAAFMALKDGEMDALYVAEGARRQGRGSALVAHAKSLSPHLSLWTFQANAQARAFYAAHGFAEAERTEGDNDERLPDIRLTWRRS